MRVIEEFPIAADVATHLESRAREAMDVVEADQVESAIVSKKIGDRIRMRRMRRMRRSMGLVELGRKTGLSASFLSQLETGRVVPTVRNLARIALAFNKDLVYFFRDEQPITFRLLRQTERMRLQNNSGVTPTFLSENLSSLISDGSISPCIAEFRGIDEDDAVLFRPRIFEGMEFTMVTEGELLLTSEDETRLLEAGDVAWVDATRKRHYTCAGGSNAKAIIITRHNRT